MDAPKGKKKARAPEPSPRVAKMKVKKEKAAKTSGSQPEIPAIDDDTISEASTPPQLPITDGQALNFNFDNEKDEENRVIKKEMMAHLGIESLKKVQTVMREHGASFPECEAWANEIGRIFETGKLPRILVGLLGYTGAGKSSLINALIEEELVLSCNAMRASTSVVVEVTWNDSDLPEEAYRAEVTFLSADEWMAEFEILSGDIKGASTSADAAMALAKLEAVYSGIPINSILEMSPKELAKERDLSSVLGKSITISKAKPAEFYEAINSYIDSNNKADSTTKAGLTYWPLVRLVKLFLKADILKHGLVLVDLPGLGDSNIGRTQVAEQYIKNLDYMWVIADIVRAIDDQVARDLMGRSFKRQLLMDGKYHKNFVTFVMTKTDQINTQEVISSLNLRNTVLADILKEEAGLERTLTDLQAQIRDSRRIQKDQTLSLSSANSDGLSSKKRKYMEASREDTQQEVHSEEQQQSFRPPSEAEQEEKKLRVKIKDINRSMSNLKLSMRELCIEKRNRYTQNHLRSEFQNGRQEFEEELAESGEEVPQAMLKLPLIQPSGSLETFCVSAKAYQKLRGRFKRESKVKGFSSLQHTQIPSLQAFAHRCTFGNREETADRVRTEVTLLCVSIRSWAENGNGPSILSPKQIDLLKAEVDSHFEILKSLTTKAARNVMVNIRRNIKTHVEANIDIAKSLGSIKAVELAKEITTRDIAAMSWKALCRRYGEPYITSKKVQHHFNEEFLSIFLEPLTAPWNDTFQTKIPKLHEIYSNAIIKALRAFRKSLESSVRTVCGSYSAMQKVLDQVPFLEDRIRQTVKEALRTGQNHAQEAHRTVGGTVKDSMKPCFVMCNQESGIGMVLRLKGHLLDHIEQNRDSMFTAAGETVVRELDSMTKILQRRLSQATRSAQNKILKDVRGVIAIAGAQKKGLIKDPKKEKLRLLVLAELETLTTAWAKISEASAERPRDLANDHSGEEEIPKIESDNFDSDDTDSSDSISGTGEEDSD